MHKIWENKNCSVDNIRNLIGNKSELVVREILIGIEKPLNAVVMYLNGLTNKDVIDRDILNPLMLHIKEGLSGINDIENYICKKYIAVSSTYIETDINKAVDAVNSGKTIVIVECSPNFIIVDTTGGIYRAISEPVMDISLKGPREGFVENLQTNVSILRRRIKDKNLKTERLVVGTRSQTEVVLAYIDDIVDKNILNGIRNKINKINLDSITSNNFIEESIDEHPYSVFPQAIGSEKPDIIQANLMEGRIALFLNGSPYVTVYPTVFMQFFQTPEDYYGRVTQAFLVRVIRILAVFIVISFPAIYITFIKFNAELIPVEFIESVVQSRRGIALTPFMSLLGMKITIEFLREGGLRLPSKIGQTLSVVGGIIIGDAALKAKIVSSITLFVAGISTVASFAISNYQMSIAVRILSYPMLMLANWLGVLGIVIGWFFIVGYLCSIENFGVPYLEFHKNDMKDTFVRMPIPQMQKRPEAIPNNNPIRQGDLKNNEDESKPK